jgi:hypothetical protein
MNRTVKWLAFATACMIIPCAVAAWNLAHHRQHALPICDDFAACVDMVQRRSEQVGYGCAVMLQRFNRVTRAEAVADGMSPGNYDECARIKAAWDAR